MSSSGGRGAATLGARGDGSGTVVASLFDKGGTVTRWFLRILGFSGTVEVTSGGSVSFSRLVLVVLVESKGELLPGAAHAVSAVFTAGSISRDSLAGILVGTTDASEELADLLECDGGFSDAGQALDHAGAERLVGSWWKMLAAGLPGRAVGALAESGVGWLIRIHLDTRGLDLADLLLEVVEVRELLGLLILNLDETCCC